MQGITPIYRHVVLAITTCVLMSGGLLTASAAARHSVAEGSPARAARYEFTKLTVEQGLSQNHVISILQDSKGFMWFGTQDGLNLYDGYSVTVYRNDPRDSTTIPANTVLSMYEDRKGRFWVGSRGGLCRFVPRDKNFIRYIAQSQQGKGPRGNGIYSIAEGGDGLLWLGTTAGIRSFDPVTQRFQDFPPPANTRGGYPGVRSLLIDETGAVWYGRENGHLGRVDPKSGTTEEMTIPFDSTTGIRNNMVQTIFRASSGQIWLGCVSGLYRLDLRTRSLEHRSFRHSTGERVDENQVTTIAEDENGRLWLAGNGEGAFVYDPRTGSSARISREPSRSASLSTDYVTRIYRDRTGTIWLGTNGGGVQMLASPRERFAKYKILPEAPPNAVENYVNTLLVDAAGRTWAGSRGGLCLFDTNRAPVIFFRGNPGAAHGLTAGSIRSVYQDHAGTIWAGGGGMGLFSYDEKHRHFRNHPVANIGKRENEANFIFAMLEDHRGVFWIATGAGLHRFDRATGRAQLWKSPDGVPALSMNIWSLAEDRAGHLWVGTAGEGLFEMDAARAIVRHYRHDPTDPRSISDNSICSIFEDPQGRFWIGTTNGLNLLDRSAGTLSVYTSRDGLPNNMIYGILADGKGNLWMSTNKGIARFTPGTGRFRCFDLYDGLQSNEFNQGAWHRSRSGELLFGGVDGFNSFYPDNIVENTIAPPVLITTFKVADKIVPFDRPVSDMDEVEVPWQENVFSLDFVALGYREPAKNQYAYMLEGFDKQWVHCGTRRYAAYTNLDGGSYVFRVKGSNNDGLWNEKGAAVHIRVIPPPWRTWWAYVLYVLFAVAAVGAIIQFRVRRVLAVERLRQRIAADLHDDIGSGLTRISLLSDILRQQLQSGRGDADAPSDAFTTSGRGIEGGIGRIGVISRELTESMTDVVWSIDPRNDSLEKLLQRILLFAVEMCESKEIELEYSAPAAADQRRRIGSDVARCVLLLVKESVNNLVRHSGCARASLAIGIASGALTIRVRDDGRGFDAEQLKRINGLENMRARAAKLGGTLEIRSAPGEGTTLEASIPLGRENRTIGRLLRLDAINRFLRHGT